MTGASLQRNWIIAILMLIFSLLVSESIENLDIKTAGTLIEVIALMSGWVGAIMVTLLTGFTASDLHEQWKRL